MRTAGFVAVLLGSWLVAQEPTCRLEGQVVDPLQQAVANAEVTASLAGEVIACTHSDGSGLFVFGRLPYREVIVQARAAGPDIGAAWLDLLGLERQFVRITTMPARAVTGIVRNEDGEPVGGAWLVSAPQWQNLSTDATTLASSMVQANARGEFTLSHVPFGHNLLRAWAPDHEVGEHAVDGPDAVAVTCQVARRARQERSFALDGASAAQLAAARLETGITCGGYPLPLPPSLHRPVLADGEWHVRGWPIADAMTARVVLDGVDLVPRVHFVPADCSGGTQHFSVRHDDRARLRGRLTGTAARAGLWVVAMPAAVTPDRARVLGRTTDEGAFDLPAPVAIGEIFQLRVLDPEVTTVRQAPQASRGWWQAQLETSHRYEIPVAAARQVQLRVVGPDGIPVLGAEVALVPLRHLLVAATGRDLVLGDDEPLAIAHGTTGSDGRLTLAGLDLMDDEELQCQLCFPESTGAVTVRVRSATLIRLGDVPLPPGATLSITAKDSAGQPAPGVPVCVALVQHGRFQNLWLRCGRDARLVLTGLPPQTCGIWGIPGVVTGASLDDDATTEVHVLAEGER